MKFNSRQLIYYLKKEIAALTEDKIIEDSLI